MVFKALNGYVLIKDDGPSEAKTVSPGGVLIPEGARKSEETSTATVLKVSGDGVDRNVNVGSVVYVSKYVGEKIMVDGEEYRAVLGRDLIGVMVDEEDKQ